MGRKAKRRKVYLKQRDRWEAPSEGGEDLFSVAPAFLTCPPLWHLTGWLYILLQTQFLSKDTALSKLLDLSPFLWSPPWKQKYNKPLSSLPLIQFSSVAQSCPTLCDPMNLSTPDLPSITNSRSSPKLMSIESVMPSSHLILCRPLLLLLPIPPSIRVFSNESTLCMR